MNCTRNRTGAYCRLVFAGHFVILILLNAAAFATGVVSAVDGGGKRVSSLAYTMDCSVGGIGGNASAPNYSGKNGYIGQLTDVVGVSVTGTPATVNEGATSQLKGTATMDDATATAVIGGEIAWNSPAYPLTSIDSNGLTTAGVVYASTNGTVTGSYLGRLGSGTILVLDSSPDNYGDYAGDTLPDSWQVQYFGQPPNANSAPALDPDGDGQNNQFEYTAGVVPTNSASLFVLRIANVSGQPGQKNLVFDPRFTDRTYTPEFRVSLTSGSYQALTGTSTSDNGQERTVTDLNATESAKFYRVRITYP